MLTSLPRPPAVSRHRRSGADRRLIEDVEGLAAALFAQFPREFDPLRLPPESVVPTAELDVPEAHVVKELEPRADGRDVLEKGKAWLTVMSRTSAMLIPLYRISSVSGLKRFPRQISQVMYTSGRKCISILMRPFPSQASQRPPLTLKLNRPALCPMVLDSGSCAKRSRMWEKAPVYVTGFERGFCRWVAGS